MIKAYTKHSSAIEKENWNIHGVDWGRIVSQWEFELYVEYFVDRQWAEWTF
jgi:hypothetical protein